MALADELAYMTATELAARIRRRELSPVEDEDYRLSALDLSRDQRVRSEIYDAIQRVLDDYHLLVTPTLACLPVDNANDGNTVGPSRINDVEVDPLIGCVSPISSTSPATRRHLSPPAWRRRGCRLGCS